MRIPRHEPRRPETLTDVDYANLLRVPDRRTLAGKRDHAWQPVLGDCGLRSAELRGLHARDLRRPAPMRVTPVSPLTGTAPRRRRTARRKAGKL